MQKKDKTKKGTSNGNGHSHNKFRSHSERDALHAGRCFSKRKIGVWTTYSLMNKICSEASRDEEIGVLGESL